MAGVIGRWSRSMGTLCGWFTIVKAEGMRIVFVTP